MTIQTPLLTKCGKAGYAIREGTILGLDTGIATCGWALLDTKHKTVLGAGTWCFEPPEIPKTRESKAKSRRLFRGQRRRLRRRRQRMRAIRLMLFQHGLLATPQTPGNDDSIPLPTYDPWTLRAEALDRKLSGEEFAACLIHIAKHRGYRSNSKAERAKNAPPDDKKVLIGLAKIEERSAKWRTVGEMFARDEAFETRKRNREGSYLHTIRRSLHENEVHRLFDAQRRLGSGLARTTLEKVYTSVAFHQRPLQDSEAMLGPCPFEPGEKRASALAYSFELFRFLSKLVNCRIYDGSKSGRALTREELAAAASGFGSSTKTISWTKLKSLIGAPRDTRFVGVGDDPESQKKDVARASKGSAYGSGTLYRVIGETAWKSLIRKPQVLDAIAHVLTFREDIDRIRAGLEALELNPVVHNAVMQGVEDGTFAGFSKAGHISTEAARRINPYLLAGYVYSDACEKAGYDHAQQRPANFKSMTNPVARRAILQTLKQVNALVRHNGFRPEMIHVELGREVGKGPEERGRMKKGIDERTAQRQKAKERFCELVGRDDCSHVELQRYELWEEQEHFCMFCSPENCLDPHDLLNDRHAAEIEHILPLSRSHDNSWHNKALACTRCNREKTNRTPWEWFGQHDEARWQRFEFRVQGLKKNGHIKGLKVRNLLIRDYDEREQGFIERNKNDMRYAARVVLSELKNLYSDGELTRIVNGEPTQRYRIRARPGAITATLRRFWGLDRFKYLPGNNGKMQRVEDERHHAVDAIIIAACSEGLLNRLTRAIQEQEARGLRIRDMDFPPPWPDFASDVAGARGAARVARSENRRARGAGHAATIRKIRIEDANRIAYERVSVDKLTAKSLERIKDPERNSDSIEALSAWIEAGKPKDLPPTRNNGHPIRKITLRSEANPQTQRAGLEAHEGLVDNAEMVRLDVFDKDRKYYLVPIYTHQIADRTTWPQPPNKAVVAGKHEDDWTLIGTDYRFRFSLYSFSWVELTKADGNVINGFYRGMDRTTGAITLSDAFSRQKLTKGIGVRTLRSLTKFQVDRLGNRHEVQGEPRLWHGADCT